MRKLSTVSTTYPETIAVLCLPCLDVFRVPHRQSFLSFKINPDNTQTLNCAYELYHQITCNANLGILQCNKQPAS